MGSTLVTAIVLVPGGALACSGPDAMSTILQNERTGWLLWGGALLAAGAAAATAPMRREGWRARWPLVAVLVLHPGWWMSARSGDCGFTLRSGSYLMTAVAILVAGVAYLRARSAKPPPSTSAP